MTVKYPLHPGFKNTDTSILAAEQMKSKAQTLRDEVMALIARRTNITTHECAEALGRSVPAVQPRMSELSEMKLIIDSGIRRVNLASGKRAIAWQIAERQMTLF